MRVDLYCILYIYQTESSKRNKLSHKLTYAYSDNVTH